MKNTNKFLLECLKLPLIETYDDLSDQLSLSKTILYLFGSKTASFYYSFSINKKNGSKRKIDAPTQRLKLVQKWILENILYKIPISNQAMGFRKGTNYNIKGNAEIHKHNIYYLQIDLHNYFPSINRNRVFYIFKNIGYNDMISNWFSNVCTLNSQLPQGAVTSPYISNIISRNLDKRLEGLCVKREISYSRYADDMTFSCDNKEQLRRIKKIIYDIISDEDFAVNEEKTRFMSNYTQKHITGVTISNGKLKASKDIKRRLRSMIHRAIISTDYSKRNIILGYISFVNYIEPGYKDKIIEYINGYQKKDITYFEDIVEQYNKNKFFKECNDLELKKSNIKAIREFEEMEEHLADIYADRDRFLESRK